MAWWQILLICLGSVALWIALSALLYRPFFKRFYDVVLSGFALLVLSPILVILIILGAIKMKGNPFFTQLRPGKIDKKTGEEKIFKLIKFRSMTCEKDENGNLLPDEKRLTRYGKILRATSLDELPELINIFIGNMSNALVGSGYTAWLIRFVPKGRDLNVYISWGNMVNLICSNLTAIIASFAATWIAARGDQFWFLFTLRLISFVVFMTGTSMIYLIPKEEPVPPSPVKVSTMKLPTLVE